MEPERVLGGSHDELTPAAAAGLTPPYPPDVAKVLSHLANLIDRSIAVRGVGMAVRDFAAAFLGVPTTAISVTTEELPALDFQLAGLAFAEDLAAHDPDGVIGEDMEEPPRWEVLDFGDLRLSVPYELAAAFRGGTLAPCPLVVSVGHSYRDDLLVAVHSRSTEAGHARAYLDRLLERARRQVNPFRGRILEASVHPMFGLAFRAARLGSVSRSDLILPSSVWAEIDRNVHGFFRALPELRRAGLDLNRGILLEGPPGTGKTALSRVLALELAGVTVVFCASSVVTRSVSGLYRQVEQLAPALVVMEDIDLVVGHRRSGADEALLDFLLALDGAMSAHEGVVTVATVNDASAIDPAGRRSARFDRVIAIPLPDRADRATILQRYLRDLDHTVEVPRVAAATDGLSGADLRELVSLALISREQPGGDGARQAVSTELLLELVDESRRQPGGGTYL